MSDDTLRDLERRWKQSGCSKDEAAFLRGRARRGDLAQRDLELAAYLGHAAASLVVRPGPPILDTLEVVIDGIVSSQAPSRGDNLRGFLHDLGELLERSTAFTSHTMSIFEGSDPWGPRQGLSPSNMVDVQAEVSGDVESLQDLARELQRVWNSVRYSYFEATSLGRHKEATVLRFVTVIERGDVFVSGTITVAGSNYPALTEKSEKGFGGLPLLSERFTRLKPDLGRWVRGLGKFSQEACDRAGIAAARAALPAWQKAFPDDPRPLRAIEAHEAWILCPCEPHAEALRAASSAASLMEGAAARPDASKSARAAALATCAGDGQTRRAAQATSEGVVREAIREELVPWVLGRADPLLGRTPCSTEGAN